MNKPKQHISKSDWNELKKIEKINLIKVVDFIAFRCFEHSGRGDINKIIKIAEERSFYSKINIGVMIELLKKDLHKIETGFFVFDEPIDAWAVYLDDGTKSNEFYGVELSDALFGAVKSKLRNDRK